MIIDDFVFRVLKFGPCFMDFIEKSGTSKGEIRYWETFVHTLLYVNFNMRNPKLVRWLAERDFDVFLYSKTITFL